MALEGELTVIGLFSGAARVELQGPQDGDRRGADVEREG